MMNSNSPAGEVITIIVNYGLPEVTIRCVNSVLEADYRPSNVLLVDNGSTDDSVEILSATFPNLPILTIPKNIGFVGGYNTGISEALKSKASYFFILNNDTTVDREAISSLVFSGWDIAIPKILFYDRPNVIWAAGCHWRKFPPGVVVTGMGKKDGPKYSQPHKLQYATGCALLVKRNVLERLKGFDPEYENHVEDYDFFYRLNEAGFQAGYVPKARILHMSAPTQGRTPKKRRWYQARNSVLFYGKKGRFSAFTLYGHITWFYLRELLKGNFSDLPDYWRGFRDGFHQLNGSGK
jgi:GT2 family glycosyltransferase